MSEVSSTENHALSALSVTAKHKQQQANNPKELGQDAFLKLMITQMENQNPLDPQDNSEFVAQLAQFSSVEALDKLNTRFESFSNSFLSNQALQASSLVGRSVTVDGDRAELSSINVVSGVAKLPASADDLKFNIYSDTGALVDTVDVGTQVAGDVVFRWNGKNFEVGGKVLDWQSSHQQLQEGIYQLEATATIDGKVSQLDMAVSVNVNSVTLGANGGLTLNLAGVGPVSLAEVKQFN